MNKIDNIVDAMLKQHKGGEIFFDNLDESFRNKDIIQLTREYINYIIKENQIDYVVVSGGFGSVFSYFNPDMKNLICVEGGLRDDGEISEHNFVDKNMINAKCLFLDDSYYLGRTRSKIDKAIETKGGQLIKVFVLYDGSETKDDMVESFYRYYK